ncbi:hypothetical protein [Microvirga lotononidis]|uniref:Uncharacterized protein n=1 Tax=Microvirga lotononidis TaxID=864069 RepID=I4YRQ2_9HYPH|nr:hypothetical protein [Microvirga lotononidis]EIM26644.1 hypothetical protein MicloDRAFT_00031930 [Microvirga lotononidis]WQO32075.1 hypothetical protein U0023_35330 [Microvirga lotononidis]
MKLYLPFLAGLLITTSASAGTIGKIAIPRFDTDDEEAVFLLQDTEASLGECKGQKALDMYWASGGKSELGATGCWVPTEKNKVLLKVLTSSGETNITYLVSRKRIEFSGGAGLPTE